MTKEKEVTCLISMDVFKIGYNLLPDNAQLYIASITQKKLTKLTYETLLCPPFSSDLSPTHKHFFTLFMPKKFHSKKVETTFKDFLSSKHLKFLSYMYK